MPDEPRNILVMLPNWVGDAVMFTPLLRQFRRQFPQAQMTLAGRPGPVAVLRPNPWTDKLLVAAGLADLWRLREQRFDLAVLGPNSFRSGLGAWLAGATRRVGYGRDGRGLLLSDALKPPRQANGDLAIVPAIDYYLGLGRAFGCQLDDRRMELAIDSQDQQRAGQLLEQAGFDPTKPLAVLNPGGSYGTAKLYPAGRFAAVANGLAERLGYQIIINAGPGEEAIAQALQQAMGRPPLLNLATVGNSLGLLKAIIARAGLVVTNDTGPRHIAAALGVNLVTIFGPTAPGRTELYYSRERIVRVDLRCSPCQKKTCPLAQENGRHRCMLAIPPEMVLAAAGELSASVAK